jgi:hypothetical protein
MAGKMNTFLSRGLSSFAKSPPLSHAFHDISKEKLVSLQIGGVNFIKRKYTVSAIY